VVDGLVDGGGVDGRAVADGAEVADVEPVIAGLVGLGWAMAAPTAEKRRGAGQTRKHQASSIQSHPARPLLKTCLPQAVAGRKHSATNGVKRFWYR
jgi:hypothetical protein